jgi:hypothetical protein
VIKGSQRQASEAGKNGLARVQKLKIKQSKNDYEIY